MKTTHSLLAALLLWVALPAFSQEDTRSEIMNLPESEFNFVNKARRLLGTHIQDGNTIEATKVKEALLNEFNGEVSEAFYISEYMHLLYALGEYEELLDFMKQVDFNQMVSSNVSTSSQTDNLGRIIFENTMAFSDIFEIDIKDTIESDRDRDFLLLLLAEIAHQSQVHSPEREAHTEMVNKLANKFLSDYPDSPYNQLVRERIRFEFAEADWGIYWDFGLGGSINSGKLRENLGGGGFAATMIFEYRHKKILGQVQVDVTNGKLSNDIEINNTTWYKESVATNAGVSLNAGYLLLENKRWSIYPSVGMGYASIGANTEDTKEDPNLKKLKLNCFYPQLGLNFDFKYFITDPYSGKKSPFGRFSLQYKYKMFNFERNNPIFQGHQHFIILTYGLGGRPLKRVE